MVLRTIGLGKMYRIGGQRQAYRTLRDTLVQTAIRPIERIRHPGAATHRSEVLWALRDVDLEIQHGEALGIIGRNGAGKSTLLKVLSRITEPTEGRVEVKGRVAALLEVGTGFHPELTGRENIQLNGAILGMTRAEIKSKFDEIVDFSEIGRFLDTPVKRYSSGMFVRLAFAVAAYLEPEILVVDEVLAVGDAAFQKKCLGKMEDVAGHGRTVLFVSHNMAAVTSLCSRAVLLENGRLAETGSTREVIDSYLRRGREASSTPLVQRTDRDGSGSMRFTALALEDDRRQSSHLGHERQFRDRAAGLQQRGRWACTPRSRRDLRQGTLRPASLHLLVARSAGRIPKSRSKWLNPLPHSRAATVARGLHVRRLEQG